MRRLRRAAALSLAAAAGLSGAAQAAPVMVLNTDAAGQGFNDTRAATPVGGNSGTTIGQQRLNAFRRAAEMWGAALDGNVPIVIDASFAPLACSATEVTLGHARPTSFTSGGSGLPPDIWLPFALANQIAEEDLYPNESDIEATFNGGLFECTGGLKDWYYGFDGRGGDKTDLMYIVLHELGHGLGFTSLISPTDGVAPPDGEDVFASHVYDNGTARAWSAMTDAQRAVSVRNVRQLVWSGQNVQRQAAQILAAGAPLLRTQPALAGLRGHIGEAEFGPYLADRPDISGTLLSGVLDPIACTLLNGPATGRVVMFIQPLCARIQAAAAAQQAGALAALFPEPTATEPASTVSALVAELAQVQVGIPAIAISAADATTLSNGGSGLAIQLSADAARHVGADAQGRPYLWAADPVDGGSSLVHWDKLARPDLVMEPEATIAPVFDLRMELALLRDLGWITVCGNGSVNAGEACDQGAQNGAPGSTCRSDCTVGGTGGAGGGTGGGAGGQGGAAGGGGRGGTGGVAGASGTGGAGGVGAGGQGGATGGSTGVGGAGGGAGGVGAGGQGGATGGSTGVSGAGGGAAGAGGAEAGGGGAGGSAGIPGADGAADAVLSDNSIKGGCDCAVAGVGAGRVESTLSALAVLGLVFGVAGARRPRRRCRQAAGAQSAAPPSGLPVVSVLASRKSRQPLPGGQP